MICQQREAQQKNFMKSMHLLHTEKQFLSEKGLRIDHFRYTLHILWQQQTPVA